MAAIAAGLATSHLAMVLRSAPEADRSQIERFQSGFTTLRDVLRSAAVETLLVISAEHVNKFFLDNMPAFAVGTAETYEGPVEDLPIARRRIEGDAELSELLLRGGISRGVDWARAGAWELDHGMMVPLHFLDPEATCRIVPVFVNCSAPPYPTVRRCYQVGRIIGETLRSCVLERRVAIIACGGLSHSPGDVRMGFIDEDFDRHFMQMMCSDPRELADIDDRRIEAAGSSAGEVRAWIMAAGMFTDRWRQVCYEPIASFGTGCAQAYVPGDDS